MHRTTTTRDPEPMSSTHPTPSTSDDRPHEQRIVDALEDRRDILDRLANSDTTFAPRAQAALDWLTEHQQSEGDETDA